MSNNKSINFEIVTSKKVSNGDTIDYKKRKMYITKIKSVEITPHGELLVTGLCKEDQVSRMLWKYSRNE
ncbi:hypothetical protein [Paenibacillus polymyxa]|uniref:Uncharacterized protein n=1 Tax=Paenibacillus polymyxa (strain SC2) TaxID=886882 RepID=E3EK40_PAEPS|nr:hypothetical protein [Paenibacillus polymyxa]ADO59749.1 hypothetical protein PPSC2_26435 [Paenibacillus polymyxa SC2]WPQ60017.1 hypothetical protein SKN87_27630 [Paenibacillus polymyxa]